MALKKNGSLMAWGYNDKGQLGDGSYVEPKVPAPVGADRDWAAVAAGRTHSLALKKDGSLWGWGSDAFGQLGQGTAVGSQDTPVQIGNDKEWAAVSAGDFYTFALKKDGSLWAWGRNTKIGLVVDEIDFSPVQVGKAKDWATVSGRGNHASALTVALKKDGSLWAWGESYPRWVGGGSSGQGANSIVPAQVGTAKDWVAVATGAAHALALKKDGSLWTWGGNGSGQLGQGTKDYDAHSEPVQVGEAKDWAAVAAGGGGSNSLALKKNGSLWAWGRYTFGVEQAVPVQVGAEKDWAAVSVSDDNIVALKKDGSLWDRVTPSGKPPVQVGTAKDWAAVATSGSGHHTLALKKDGASWAWGSDSHRQLGRKISQNTPIRVGEGFKVSR
jgi:alpha-tubulin suppressor-like RCC1 family protein